jgi:ABC-type bacteriocin/lantibiotic exporter with double-glycine peptidase domain
MLQITDLTYRIAGKLLLDNASVTVPDGHKIGIVGKNGAGKTTLYKLILGELESDDGAANFPAGGACVSPLRVRSSRNLIYCFLMNRQTILILKGYFGLKTLSGITLILS